MGFERGGRGGRGGFGRGGRGGFRGARGGGRGGFGSYNTGPPDRVVEIGTVSHDCEGNVVCESTNTMIPYFNAPIYLKNKQQIGKVEEVMGPINKVFFTVKTGDGFNASSFKIKDAFFIDPAKLLPLARFTNQSKGAGRGAARSRGRGRGTSRGGRGGFRGGRGGSMRGSRGRGRGRGGFRGGGRGRGAH